MNKSPQLPKYILRFFRWFCHPDYVEDIEGERFDSMYKHAPYTLLSRTVLPGRLYLRLFQQALSSHLRYGLMYYI